MHDVLLEFYRAAGAPKVVMCIFICRPTHPEALLHRPTAMNTILNYTTTHGKVQTGPVVVLSALSLT